MKKENRKLEYSEFDWYGTQINGMHTPLYYYYLDEDLIAGEPNNAKIMGHNPSIINVLYTPFITELQLRLFQIYYDQARFGSLDAQDPNKNVNAFVYRVFSEFNSLEKQIGTIFQYQTKPNIPFRHWQNESKLQQYPYTNLHLTDYMNTPLILKPQYMKNLTNNKVIVNQTISDKATYNIYVEGYKGDTLGQTEGMVSQVPLDLPTSSSAYSQFIATNKASFLQSNAVAYNQETLTSARTELDNYNNRSQNVMSGIGAVTSMNLGGALTAGIGMGHNSYMNSENYAMKQRQDFESKQARIGNSLARVSDLMSTPRNTNIGGGDVIQVRENSKRKVELIKYMPNEDLLWRLGDYFAMYGYKQNQLMGINIHSRFYYNYIKTIKCNIKGDKIPKDELEELKALHDNGITFWHKDNDVDMFDYSQDNREVY